MTDCDCAQYSNLELVRSAISTRIRESKTLRRHLQQAAAHPAREHVLFRCPVCGQYWQQSRAWNWANEPYLFRVPPIDPPAWLAEVYLQPDDLLIYLAVMEDYRVRNAGEVSTEACREPSCPHFALARILRCFEH